MLPQVTVSASGLQLGSDDMATPVSVLEGDELVLRREGTLGTLLDLVESVEQQDLGHTLTLLDAAGGLSLSDLTVAEIEAMVWTHQIADESNHA